MDSTELGEPSQDCWASPVHKMNGRGATSAATACRSKGECAALPGTKSWALAENQADSLGLPTARFTNSLRE
jgi:hypothetical protein